MYVHFFRWKTAKSNLVEICFIASCMETELNPPSATLQCSKPAGVAHKDLFRLRRIPPEPSSWLDVQI